jgi:peptidoglycan/xylan/chitin deacetylase (PgdA/CDA1 family)
LVLWNIGYTSHLNVERNPRERTSQARDVYLKRGLQRYLHSRYNPFKIAIPYTCSYSGRYKRGSVEAFMNLISFSVKTKGMRNFSRRLWTVFARFGISEARMRLALQAVVETLHESNGAPTFFIPAVVLARHPQLIRETVHNGVEIGIHGYVHNDYRTLSRQEQFTQTEQAISVFRKTGIPYQGFRNPYLGWTEDSLNVYASLGLNYESNIAVLHEVIDLDTLSPQLRSGYLKSLKLFQAVPYRIYALRPRFEGSLLRIPTSIPDDEMLFDRLRITDASEVGQIWSAVLQRVYDAGGLYTLNFHPERGVLCRQSLHILVSYACSRPLPVWLARIGEVAQWWKERNQFKLLITPLGAGRWQVQASCTSRAAILARKLSVEDENATAPWYGADVLVRSNKFTVCAPLCPCIGVSPETPQQVLDFLTEQGYPSVRALSEEANTYALFLHFPDGLGKTRDEQFLQKAALVEQVEALDAPLLRFACWPEGYRAALAISGDIDSVTVQDFFLRILEVFHHR